MVISLEMLFKTQLTLGTYDSQYCTRIEIQDLISEKPDRATTWELYFIMFREADDASLEPAQLK